METHHTFYYIFIREAGSGDDNVTPLDDIGNSVLKKLWNTIDSINTEQKRYKQTNRLKNMINPAADLL